MQIAPEQGALFAILVELLGARQCLEIGTFTGYSSLAVMLAMPPDGRMVCCDVSEEYTAIARRYWAEAGVADRVDLRIAPAVDTLDALLAEGRVGHVRPRVHRRRQERLSRLLRALRRARPSGRPDHARQRPVERRRRRSAGGRPGHADAAPGQRDDRRRPTRAPRDARDRGRDDDRPQALGGAAPRARGRFRRSSRRSAR